MTVYLPTLCDEAAKDGAPGLWGGLEESGRALHNLGRGGAVCEEVEEGGFVEDGDVEGGGFV